MQKNKQKAETSGHFILLCCYILFCGSFLIAAVPVSATSLFSLMFCIMVLSLVYSLRVRGKQKRNKRIIVHTTFIIRTFWRSCLILIVSAFAGFLYMLVMVDYHAIGTCGNTLFDALWNLQIRRVTGIFSICGALIFEENRIHLHIVSIVAFCPVFLYVLLRCVKGSILLAYNR